MSRCNSDRASPIPRGRPSSGRSRPSGSRGWPTCGPDVPSTSKSMRPTRRPCADQGHRTGRPLVGQPGHRAEPPRTPSARVLDAGQDRGRGVSRLELRTRRGPGGAVAGAGAELLWHGDASVGAVDAIVLPGGFAHGDYLRPGASAPFPRSWRPCAPSPNQADRWSGSATGSRCSPKRDCFPVRSKRTPTFASCAARPGSWSPRMRRC